MSSTFSGATAVEEDEGVEPDGWETAMEEEVASAMPSTFGGCCIELSPFMIERLWWLQRQVPSMLSQFCLFTF